MTSNEQSVSASEALADRSSADPAEPEGYPKAPMSRMLGFVAVVLSSAFFGRILRAEQAASNSEPALLAP